MGDSMVKGVIRTYVPLLVTVLAGWLATLGVKVDGAQSAMLVTVIGAVAGAAWYALARVLERRWPRAGALLGVPHAPVYPAKGTAASTQPPA